MYASIHLLIHQLCASQPSCLTSMHSYGYLSTFRSIHPQPSTSFHMPPLYKSIHLSIRPYCFIHAHISMDGGWCAISSLSISEMIGLSLCSSFNKWTLQTLVGSSVYPINHLSTTLSFLTFSYGAPLHLR